MATMQKKSFWQQYGSLILILGGIIIGALIGAFAPNVGTTIKPVGDIFLNLLFTIVVKIILFPLNLRRKSQHHFCLLYIHLLYCEGGLGCKAFFLLLK